MDRVIWIWLKILCVLIIGSPAAHASAEACQHAFDSSSGKSDIDNFHRYLQWERNENTPRFRQTVTFLDIPFYRVPLKGKELLSIGSLPQDILTLLEIRDETILWPIHPWNSRDMAKYQHKTPEKFVRGYLTASRSLVLEQQGYSIKLPVDYPHGPTAKRQENKLQLDGKAGLGFSRYIKTMDKKLKPDPELHILLEDMAMLDNESGQGASFRNIRALIESTKNGNFILPALSIPYVGRAIARLNRKSFNEFWRIHYAELLGRAKAKLLLRYGLQMETPNTQNFLLEFDSAFRPTGRIFFRDVADIESPTIVKEAFKSEELNSLALDRVMEKINPFSQISMDWFQERSDPKYIDSATRMLWREAHNISYADYLAAELGETKQILEKDPTEDVLDSYTYRLQRSGAQIITDYLNRRSSDENP